MEENLIRQFILSKDKTKYVIKKGAQEKLQKENIYTKKNTYNQQCDANREQEQVRLKEFFAIS